LQISDALGAAAVQLGPDAHAALAVLNKELGLPHGKAARLLERLLRTRVARATSARSILRTARRCQPAYDELPAAIRGSPAVAADETGWRVAGKNAWLHVQVTPAATWCGIDPERGAEAPAAVLGWDYAGVLVHDGWSAYDRFTRARHQQCVAHLVRRCHEMLQTAVGGAVRLPRRVLTLVDQAFAVRRAYRSGQIDEDQLHRAGLKAVNKYD
jgi:transposase